MKKFFLYSLSIFMFLTVAFIGFGIYSFLAANDEPEDYRKRGQFQGFEQTVTVANGSGIDSIIIEQSEYDTADQFIFDLKKKADKESNHKKLQALAAGIVIYSNYFFEKEYEASGLGNEFKQLREDAMGVYVAENAEDIQNAQIKLIKTINSIHKAYFGV